MRIEIEFPSDKLDEYETNELSEYVVRSLLHYSTPFTPKVTITQDEPTSSGEMP